MTDKSAFSAAEWNLLVRLPRWVVLAASNAHLEGRLARNAEDEVGLLAVAQGRQTGNAFVAEIAETLTYSYDKPGTDPAAVPSFADRAAGIATVLDRARAAVALLAAKADPADLAAYRRWVYSVASKVARASRSGGVFGVGSDRVSKAERRFLDQLTQALAG